MELKNIKASLSELSEEELRELLVGIRTSRRTAKPSAVKAKPKTTSARIAKAKKEPSFDAMLKNMTPEQLARLMTAMENGGSK